MVNSYVFIPMIFGLSVIGAVFMMVGVILKKKVKKAEQNCTEKTSATVVKLVQDTMTHTSEVGEVNSVYWRPVYEYYVGEEKYTKLSRIGRGKDYIKIGEEVTLYYNPNDPKETFIPKENINQMASIFQKVSMGPAIMIVILLILMITEAENVYTNMYF